MRWKRRILQVDGEVKCPSHILCFDRARDKPTLMKKAAHRTRPACRHTGAHQGSDRWLAGVRTTQGSPIFKDVVAAKSNIVVKISKPMARSFTPNRTRRNSAQGAQTFNEVFGATLVHQDLSRTRHRLIRWRYSRALDGTAWLAHGTDVGDRCATPPASLAVVGMRPSIGRVAHSQAAKVDRTLSADGPMARNVEDLALMLDAMSGEHIGDALSLPRLPTSFSPPCVPAQNQSVSPTRQPSAFPRSIRRSPKSPTQGRTAFCRSRRDRRGSASDFKGRGMRRVCCRPYDYVLTKGKLLKSHRDQLSRCLGTSRKASN
jgi:amidase